MRLSKTLPFGVLLLSACTSAEEQGTEEETEDDAGRAEIVIENRTGAALLFFDYAACGSDDWVETLGLGDSVPDGGEVSTGTIEPGCYDLYIEDERWCFALSTNQEVPADGPFVWTVKSEDLDCTF